MTDQRCPTPGQKSLTPGQRYIYLSAKRLKHLLFLGGRRYEGERCKVLPSRVNVMHEPAIMRHEWGMSSIRWEFVGGTSYMMKGATLTYNK